MISIDYYISVFVWLGLIIMQVIKLYGLCTIQTALKKKHYLQMRSFTKTAFVNVIYECSSYQDRIRKS